MLKLMEKISLVLALLLPLSAFAEMAVIVHPSNKVSEMDRDTIMQIFLGKISAFPSGERAIPVVLKRGVDPRENFNKGVLNKTENQYKAYWSKQVFTGKGIPPKEMDDAGSVVKLIADNPNLVGYIDAGSVTDSVKVVAKF